MAITTSFVNKISKYHRIKTVPGCFYGNDFRVWVSDHRGGESRMNETGRWQMTWKSSLRCEIPWDKFHTTFVQHLSTRLGFPIMDYELYSDVIIEGWGGAFSSTVLAAAAGLSWSCFSGWSLTLWFFRWQFRLWCRWCRFDLWTTLVRSRNWKKSSAPPPPSSSSLSSPPFPLSPHQPLLQPSSPLDSPPSARPRSPVAAGPVGAALPAALPLAGRRLRRRRQSIKLRQVSIVARSSARIDL